MLRRKVTAKEIVTTGHSTFSLVLATLDGARLRVWVSVRFSQHSETHLQAPKIGRHQRMQLFNLEKKRQATEELD